MAIITQFHNYNRNLLTQTSSLIRFFFFCVYSHSSAFVFIETFSNVFCEVCSLKWPVTIKNFALGL